MSVKVETKYEYIPQENASHWIWSSTRLYIFQCEKWNECEILTRWGLNKIAAILQCGEICNLQNGGHFIMVWCLNVLQKDRIQRGHDTAYCSQDQLGAGNVWEKNVMVVKEFFWDAYCFPLLSTTHLDLIVDIFESNLMIFCVHNLQNNNHIAETENVVILMKFSPLVAL